MANILIVEDESIVALDLSGFLKDMDHRVAGIAQSGEAAIAMAQSVKPDLILMDVLLKGRIDGIRAIETITARHAVPFIYVTAHADDVERTYSDHSGPVFCLGKPYDPKELAKAIGDALGLAQRQRENA